MAIGRDYWAVVLVGLWLDDYTVMFAGNKPININKQQIQTEQYKHNNQSINPNG